MGCVSSKILTRTGSFREELSRSLKGKHQVLQGLFISASTNGGADRFIVICNEDEEDKLTNKTTAVLQTTDDNLSSPLHDLNTWDLSEGLDNEKGDQEEKISSRNNAIIKRRQSFNGFSSEYESLYAVGINGSRSFHTVEEFDEIMMQRNRKTWEDELDRDFFAGMTVKGVEETSGNNAVIVSAKEIGLGRKKMGMELTSLTIPNAIEFPVAANTSEGMQIVNYDSAAADFYYETPKFGKYGLSIIPLNTEEERKEDPVFDEEFLSAFQVEIEQLEAEEDFLLRQVYS